MEDYSKVKKDFLKNKKIKKEYDRLKPEFDAIAEVIQRRIDKGVTQAQLAEKLGTKQSAIARFESGDYNPTLSMLNKIANALGAKLKVSIT